MILNCPQCPSRFLVADALIPKAGRTVRCGACAHEWFVERPANAPEPISMDDPSNPEVPLTEEEAAAEAAAKAAMEVDLSAFDVLTPAPGTNVPALTDLRNLPLRPFVIAAPVLCCLWLGVAMLSYFPSWFDAPVFGAIYRIFGATATEGLAFADVKMERQENDAATKTRFIFSGNIINRSTEERTVPTVRVLLNDAEGDQVWGREYPVNITLKPGEVYPFRIVNVETSFADKVKTILLDLGNGLELFAR